MRVGVGEEGDVDVDVDRDDADACELVGLMRCEIVYEMRDGVDYYISSS